MTDAAELAKEFGHDGARRDAAHQGMHVLAVGADDVIGQLGRVQDADGHRLLARIEMQKPADPAIGVFLGGTLLEGPRKPHVAHEPAVQILVHGAARAPYPGILHCLLSMRPPYKPHSRVGAFGNPGGHMRPAGSALPLTGLASTPNPKETARVARPHAHNMAPAMAHRRAPPSQQGARRMRDPLRGHRMLVGKARKLVGRQTRGHRHTDLADQLGGVDTDHPAAAQTQAAFLEK